MCDCPLVSIHHIQEESDFGGGEAPLGLMWAPNSLPLPQPRATPKPCITANIWDHARPFSDVPGEIRHLSLVAKATLVLYDCGGGGGAWGLEWVLWLGSRKQRYLTPNKFDQ